MLIPVTQAFFNFLHMTAAWEVIPPRAVITPLQYFDFTISTISGEISSWQKINCSLFSINFSASSLKKQISPTPTPALAAIPVIVLTYQY